MATNSKIQWCDHTLNEWTGCKKVSDACKYCYMYRDKERYGADPTDVIRVSQATIDKVLKQAKPGDKIFTCSWSDFFIEEADQWRQNAWDRILAHPELTWQILTKRPERIKACLPEGGLPDNVWIGVSIESQKYIDRLKYLTDLPGIRFASIEPMIGEVDLFAMLPGEERTAISNLDWVILGGESGNDTGNYRYRPSEIAWYDKIITQCAEAKVPVFMKQLGTYLSKEMGLKDRHGGDIDEFPESLKVRQFPSGYNPIVIQSESVVTADIVHDQINEVIVTMEPENHTAACEAVSDINIVNSKTMEYKSEPTREKVPVSSLELHELHERLVGVTTNRQFYLDGIKGFGHIDVPRVTRQKKVLTHYAAVMAARALGETHIEVQWVDIDDKVIPQYLMFGNLLQQKQHAAVSIAIDYLLEYFKTDAGKIWADSIKGDKEEKLAYIFGTNASAIKRFLSVAKHHRDSLCLVQEGNLTWDELMEMCRKDTQVKSKVLAAKVLVTTPVQTVATDKADDTEETTLPEVAGELNINGDDSQDEVDDGYSYTESVEPAVRDMEVGGDSVNVTSDIASYEFSEATLTMMDGRVINIKTTPAGKELSVDGKKVMATYAYLPDDGTGSNTEYYTTTFTIGNMGDCSFQIMFDQPKKMFRK